MMLIYEYYYYNMKQSKMKGCVECCLVDWSCMAGVTSRFRCICAFCCWDCCLLGTQVSTHWRCYTLKPKFTYGLQVLNQACSNDIQHAASHVYWMSLLCPYWDKEKEMIFMLNWLIRHSWVVVGALVYVSAGQCSRESADLFMYSTPTFRNVVVMIGG